MTGRKRIFEECPYCGRPKEGHSYASAISCVIATKYEPKKSALDALREAAREDLAK